MAAAVGGSDSSEIRLYSFAGSGKNATRYAYQNTIRCSVGERLLDVHINGSFHKQLSSTELAYSLTFPDDGSPDFPTCAEREVAVKGVIYICLCLSLRTALACTSHVQIGLFGLVGPDAGGSDAVAGASANEAGISCYSCIHF